MCWVAFMLGCLAPVMVWAEGPELVEYGDFTTVDEGDFLNNWKGAGFAGARLEGNTIDLKQGEYVTIKSKHEDPDRRYYVMSSKELIPISDEWDMFELTGKYRVREIDPKPASWQNFHYEVNWFDENGDPIKVDTPFVFKESDPTDSWQEKTIEVEKPAGAVAFRINIGSRGGEVVADIASVSLKPLGVDGGDSSDEAKEADPEKKATSSYLD